MQAPAVQTADAQSAADTQEATAPQGEQLPPQSRSVSSPFRTPSEHRGAAHRPAEQTPEAQSVATPHRRLAAHFEPQLPPQSTSVSSPLRKASVQLAATH